MLAYRTLINHQDDQMDSQNQTNIHHYSLMIYSHHFQLTMVVVFRSFFH